MIITLQPASYKGERQKADLVVYPEAQYNNKVYRIAIAPAKSIVDDNSFVNVWGKKSSSSIASTVNSLTIKEGVILPANFYGLFGGMWELKSIVVEAKDESSEDGMLHITDAKLAFSDLDSCERIKISGVSTEKVQSFAGMFYMDFSLTDIDLDDSVFVTSSASSLSSMFGRCKKLESLPKITFDTSNATSMAVMFDQCYNLSAVDVSSWDVSNVESMKEMFSGCSKLKSLNTSGWKDTKLTDAFGMFSGCSELTTLDLSGIDFSGLKKDQYNKVPYRLFSNCKSLTEVAINNSIERFGDNCFLNTDSLTTINFIGTREEWGSCNDCNEDENGNRPDTILGRSDPTGNEILYNESLIVNFLNSEELQMESVSGWEYDGEGLPSRYKKGNDYLKNGEYPLSMRVNGNTVITGWWRFDNNGYVLTGQCGENYYNSVKNSDFPYGIRVSTQKIIDALKEKRASSVFESYKYSASFSQDVSWFIAALHGAADWGKVTRAIFGNFITDLYWGNYVPADEFWADVADDYMNDPVKCKEVFKKIAKSKVEKEVSFFDQINSGALATPEWDIIKNAYTITEDSLSDALKERMKEDAARLGAENYKVDNEDYKKVLETIKNSEDPELYYNMYAKQIISTLGTIYSVSGDLVDNLKEDEAVKAYLEQVMETFDEGTNVSVAASNVYKDYQAEVARAMASVMINTFNEYNSWKKILGKKSFGVSVPDFGGDQEEFTKDAIVQLADAFLNTKLGKVSKFFESLEANSDMMKAFDEVITISNMKFEALRRLEEAESVLLREGYDPTLQDIVDYQMAFSVCKDLYALEYEDMYMYYAVNNMEPEKVPQEYKPIRDQFKSFTDIIFADKTFGIKSQYIKAEKDKINTMTFLDYKDHGSSIFLNGGVCEAPGKIRYYVSPGVYIKDAMITIDGNLYYFSKDGYMYSGFLNVGDSTYYFNEFEDSRESLGISASIPQFAAVKGVFSVRDKTYYANPNSYALVKNRMITIAGTQYYLNAKGERYYPEDKRTAQEKMFDQNGMYERYGNWGYNVVSSKCPVDVRVYDLAGNVVAEITNDQPTSFREDIFAEFDDNEIKMIGIPANEEFSVLITAIGSGTLDYSVTEFSKDGFVERKTDFFDISIQKGDELSGTVAATAQDAETSENYHFHSLKRNTDEADLAASSIDIGANKVAAIVNVKGNGTFIGDTIALYGEYIKLTAVPDANSTFDGWYDEAGNLITVEPDYRLRLTENTSLTAKFATGMYIADIEPQKYTGTAIKPILHVFDGDKELTANVDYRITYKNNTNSYTHTGGQEDFEEKKAPTVVIKGIGNYKGTESASFVIEPKNIEDEDVNVGSITIAQEDGKVKKPVPAVTWGKKKLKPGTDFAVSYFMESGEAAVCKGAGKYTVRLEGKGNYTGSVDRSFEIYAKDIVHISKVKLDKIPDIDYTGEATFPSIRLAYKGKELVNNEDYKLVFDDDNTSAGKKTLRIIGVGSFIGERTASYNVRGWQIKKAKIEGIEASLHYTGSDITQPLRLTYTDGKGDKQRVYELEHSVDYEAIYENNLYPGIAKVKINGKGRFTGSIEKTFKIIGTQIKNADIMNFEPEMMYTGEKLAQNETLILAGKELVRAEDASDTNGDYVAVYSGNLKAGTAKVVYKGINGYIGTITRNFKISKKNIEESDVWLTVADTAFYVKGGSKPEAELTYNGETLVLNKDYTVYYKYNNTVTTENTKNKPLIVVSGKGNFSGKLSREFSILPRNVQEAGVQILIKDVVASGKAGKWKSIPVITDSNGKKLTAGLDYDKNISYFIDGSDKVLTSKDIVDAGESIKAVIDFKGAYCGNAEATYRITLRDISKANVRVEAITYTGNYVTLDPSDISISYKKEILTSDDYEIDDTSYRNNLKKGKATVVIKGKGIYGGSKQISFTIGPRGIVWWFRNLIQ